MLSEPTGEPMKQRFKASGERAKARSLKATKRKRSSASDKAPGSASPHASAQAELARLTRELTDERRQRMATSEVLRLLSGSHGDLNHLFDTILANATNLCQANFGTLSLCEGDAFRIVATHNVPPGLGELRRREPLVRAGPLLRMAETKRLLHIADYREYVASHPADSDAAAFAKLTGVRTILEVPMLKEDDVVGAIVIYRKEVRRFEDQEIALIKDFAAQAAIAIENARLLNELRQRTKDLGEALDQQTATADVLKVISRSQFDLQQVLDNLIETATSLCGAKRGVIFRADGDLYHAAAFYNATPELIEFVKSHPIAPGHHTVTARVALERRVIHVADLQEDAEYTYALRDTEPIRTELGVPMFRGDDLVGVFILYKLKVEPFTDKQIELVTTFADQAVIAIENARLLNELRQSLEQQTATSNVLQVISSSPGDLEPVFATILEKAVRICNAKFGTLYLLEEGGLCLVAAHDVPKFLEARGSNPIQPSPGGVLDVVMRTKRTTHEPDLAATRSYAERHPRMVEAVELGGIRTVVAVPMLKDDGLVGVIAVHRREVRPFTDKQIALVENFAAQAVIAIENARLLNELINFSH